MIGKLIFCSGLAYTAGVIYSCYRARVFTVDENIHLLAPVLEQHPTKNLNNVACCHLYVKMMSVALWPILVYSRVRPSELAHLNTLSPAALDALLIGISALLGPVEPAAREDGAIAGEEEVVAEDGADLRDAPLPDGENVAARWSEYL